MAEIHALGKPTVSAETKASVVKTLKEALAKVEADEAIHGVVIIYDHLNDDWTWDASQVPIFSRVIGKLEVIKHEWIRRYLTSI